MKTKKRLQISLLTGLILVIMISMTACTNHQNKVEPITYLVIADPSQPNTDSKLQDLFLEFFEKANKIPLSTYAIIKPLNPEGYEAPIVNVVPKSWGANVKQKKKTFLNKCYNQILHWRDLNGNNHFEEIGNRLINERVKIINLIEENKTTLVLPELFQKENEVLHVRIVFDSSSSQYSSPSNINQIEFIYRQWIQKGQPGSTFTINTIGEDFKSGQLQFKKTMPTKMTINDAIGYALSKNEIKTSIHSINPRSSAILECIFKATSDLPQTGIRYLLVFSDGLEVNGYFNFERSLPTRKDVIDHTRKYYPMNLDGTTVIMAGFNDFSNPESGKVSQGIHFQEVKSLWESLFISLGVKHDHISLLNDIQDFR